MSDVTGAGLVIRVVKPTIIYGKLAKQLADSRTSCKVLGAALTLLFHIENQWRGANEYLRSPSMRAERAKLKSCRDDDIIAQGKSSAALGCGPEMISSFFPSGLARQTKREKRGWVGWRVTQGGGLGGLALGYYQAAPLGLRKGEPAGWTGDAAGRCCLCAGAHSRRVSEAECWAAGVHIV